MEAARAGHEGRGFAVVAAEARMLAQRSASAAQEIKALITDSQEKVNQGSVLVNNSGATLHEIMDAVAKVNDIKTRHLLESVSAFKVAPSMDLVGKPMPMNDNADRPARRAAR